MDYRVFWYWFGEYIFVGNLLIMDIIWVRSLVLNVEWFVCIVGFVIFVFLDVSGLEFVCEDVFDSG